MLRISAVITVILILCLLIALVWVMPSKPTYLAFALGGGTALLIAGYFAISIAREKRPIKGGAFWIAVMSLSSLSIILPGAFAAALYLWGLFSPLTWVLLIGLTLTFFFNFLAIPLSLYHKQQEAKLANFPPDQYPSVTVLLPAYNEEKVLGQAIESILEASYPNKEIVVIDDGSTDRTYAIALTYSERGVTVVRRPNGGKAAALNYGLLFATGEIVVCVDADSLVAKNSLIELVKRFQDPEVGAIAGNIKVLNRTNWLTKCQALEYITSINIFRRALDVFGKGTVVPGALGAYRRQILGSGGFYDKNTLVEDFDVTLKALKSGAVVQVSSGALAYTEAPETWADLTKQRLRWYRGNFQAMWKHRDAATNPRYGFLQKLSYPYLILSMVFLPLAGIIVIISTILALLSGMGMQLIYLFAFFLALQFLLSVLAIQLDEDDMKLVLYSPFLVVDYKHFCDYIMLKSFIDVLFQRRMEWGRIKRISTERKEVNQL